ncbi:TPA: hypothetical protein ACX6NQ_001726 [Photobacterium damselae]
MNQYQFNKILLVIISFFIYPTVVYSETITADLVGDQIRWHNASYSNNDVVQSVWQLGNKLNLLPVTYWVPALSRYSSSKEITFKSASLPGIDINVAFEHVGIEYKTAAPFNISENGKGSCSSDEVSKGYVSLREYGKSECQSNSFFSSSKKYKPFDFYRSIFKFTNLESAFSSKKVPSGTYYASVSIPIKYLVKYGATESFEVRSRTITFIINYTASFLDDVLIRGDGVMALDYDTDAHTVKGKTKFRVSVRGHLENGLKMSFISSNEGRDFSLEHKVSKKRIPYSLLCDKCEDNQVILDGKMLKDFAIIPSTFDDLDFNLKFYFNKMFFNKVDKGEYLDEVTIRFEPNL